MPFMSVDTWSTVTPGFIRAKTCTLRSSRLIFSPYSASGTHRRCVSGNANRGGITPMMVCGRPLTLIARPTTTGVAAITGLPHLVAEHDHRLGARAIVFRAEVAAEDRRLPEQ